MCVSVSLYSVCSHVFCELFRPWTEQIPVDSVFRLLVYNVQVYFREVRSFGVFKCDGNYFAEIGSKKAHNAAANKYKC